MIEFDNVTKRYADGTVAVDDLSIEAPQGKITVLVGPSGCGKTTSLRMVNRSIEATSGRILVDGRDVQSVRAVELRRGIGYVIQQGGLFPHQTVLDNIMTVPHLLGWSKKKSRERAHELLQRVGLPSSFARRYPAQLSGGQQQRVGVARALAADPPIMLMDEPFSAIDPIVRAGLQDEFLRLQEELGKTIVFVTHDIDEAIKLGDYVAVLRVGGRLAQLAPPAELLAQPADEFVEDFVGRDRGYRALQFVRAAELPVHEAPTVGLGGSLADARAVAGGDQWVLVLGPERRPAGWLDVTDPAIPSVDRSHLVSVGTTFTAEGPVRFALDGALSSPCGQAVCVDAEGAYVGVAGATEIARHVSSQGALAGETS
ncbi:ABC transporter ATP-binding protein [Prauserella muralis]|uniref:ABC-type quaternary amine transporter n=1 Tax=Prauserella muralis TaxID=588067 RepID=A0A2V4AQI0_9PSEU|nr:ABC transporter ATP-binding protein [Prauserella muralis]PXY22960.1 proline/glycine betaine ABC transporter ATP-binding protein [Prauserella muralis]